MKIRHLAGAVFGVVLGVSTAGAQTVEYKGTTQGCFISKGANFPDCNTTSSIGFDRSLVFLGGAFDQSTNGNGGSVLIGGTSPASTFGYFSLGSNPASYTGDMFRLAIDFSDPTNVSPGAVFQAVLYGTVNRKGDGTVAIDFGAPQQFSFSGPTQNGTFTLGINDIFIDPATWSDPYEAIQGTITTTITGAVTATPEPAMTALLATGLLSLIPVAQRRARKGAKA